MFCIPFDEAPYERELVSDITLRFKNGAGLRIGAQVDYCIVECIDNQDEIAEISFAELRQALFNWEDLHHDETTGFEAESHTLFFGKTGAKHTDEPYMTLSSSGNDSTSLNISVDDFLLIDWCTTHITGASFDEYGEYHFATNDWQRILQEAHRLLSYDNFDALFDDMITWEIAYSNGSNYMLSQPNMLGAGFWKEREKYRSQFRDLCKWSKLVLADDDTMDIYGF